MSEGLGGGYAGAPCAYRWVHNNEASKAGRNVNPFPTSLDEMTGEAETISWGVFPLKGEDALYVRSDGGGGFGDPLEREPARVQADVEAGTVSAEVAASVYGVVLANGAVDEAATAARRETLRQTRLATPIAAE